ncbi:MAG: hypothetical protein FWE96_06755 [Coriobacteriia bacterium]|nr:hypothetical protein [Coriobacteriia bacterium]
MTWGRGLVWYRGDGVSVPIWPKGQIGTLTPSPLYQTKPRPSCTKPSLTRGVLLCRRR